MRHPPSQRDQHPDSVVPQKDWFSTLFGFEEADYKTTQSWLRLRVEDNRLWLGSKYSKMYYEVGKFYTPSLDELRKEFNKRGALSTRTRALSVDLVFGDISELHANPEYLHATFQAASQFNCLEFIGPHVTPEDGITGYVHDKTQGPACSIACGAGTAYRNYLHKWTNSEGKAMVRSLSTRPHFVSDAAQPARRMDRRPST